MALIFIDGFDGYDINNANVAIKMSEHWGAITQSGDGFKVKSGRYDDGKSIEFWSSGPAELRTNDFWPAANTDFAIIGFNFKLTAANADTVKLELFSDDDSEGVLNFNDDGLTMNHNSVEVFNLPIADTDWHNIEIIITRISITECNIQIYVDDVNRYESAAFNPVQDYTKSQDYCAFTLNGTNGSVLTIDDFYILDSLTDDNNERIGADIRVETLFPSGSVNELWNFAGDVSRHEAVNNVPYDPTEYISTSSANQTQQFLFDDLVNIVEPLGMQIRTVAKGDPGVIYKHMVNNAIVGSTYADLTSTYKERSTIFDQGVYDVSAVNNIEAGVSS